jgi:hypothetical protein
MSSNSNPAENDIASPPTLEKEEDLPDISMKFGNIMASN